MHGTILTVSGLAALLLSPFGLIYCATKLRRDAAERQWGMIAFGVLSALQCLVAMIYFGMLLQLMSSRGLGV